MQAEKTNLLEENRRMKLKAYHASIKHQQCSVALRLADATNSSRLTSQPFCPLDAHFATNEILVMDSA